ncbi:hypothetical protein PSO31014_04447 [Pandoraea soli]|uniref:Uncharacterized protein n=1 Tax=Pandoraea soli TaxID=2508293 RepID=A0ABY6WAQ6_9BURK|nr:hypothetical protein PSO31014_04447 [Pandoraea soli]
MKPDLSRIFTGSSPGAESAFDNVRRARTAPGDQHNAPGCRIDTFATLDKVEHSSIPNGYGQFTRAFKSLMDIQVPINDANQMRHIFCYTNRTDVANTVFGAVHGIRQSP